MTVVGGADDIVAQPVELLDALTPGLPDPFDQGRDEDLDEGDAAHDGVER